MTTTVIESYDAQMLDYQNDHDIQMHMSSSDSWLQDVTPMEDDGQLAFQSKGTAVDAAPTIEVDMEAYVDDEHIEYEMVDDNHGHNPASAELLDVDLLDASAVQSPSVTVHPLPTTPSVEYSQAQPTPQISPALDLSLSVFTPVPLEQTTDPTAIIDSVAPVRSTPEKPSHVDALPSLVPPPQEPLPLPEPVDYPRGSPEQVTHSVAHLPDETSLDYHDAVLQSSVVTQSVADSHPDVEEDATPNPTFTPTIENRGESRRLDFGQGPSQPGLINNAATPVPSSDQVDSRARVEEVGGHPPDTVAQTPYVANVDAYVEGPLVVSAPPEESWGTAQENQTEGDTPSTVPAADQPAEISNDVLEEVYLEAPPPILLSIFSTDHPELCLFNKPPGPVLNEDDTSERHILLQQAPNLYYEPLDQAFEALRQDEYVSTVLEVAGNELALEAYELDLAITEDNIYAREISLHDIHTLHDSANLAGPLRLRLFISGPRFIVRYHMLQQGMIKLDMGEADASEYGDTSADIDEPHEDHEPTQHQIPGAENAAPEQQPQLEPPKDTADQPEEESEQPDGYDEPYGEEETEPYTDEIDLSALPPFADSPDDFGEGEPTEHEENVDLGGVEVATGDNVPYRTETSNTEDRHSPSQEEDTAETSLLDSNQDELTGADQTAQESHEEHTSVSGSPGVHHDTSETYGERGQPHVHEYTEKTPQSEPAELTNGQSQAAESSNEESHRAQDEAADGVNAQADINGIEELKDFDGELGETWDDELDGEGDPDTTWEAEQENNEPFSNESSVTLSSKASKRSFDEYEFEHPDEENHTPKSPGTKRPRVV